MMKMTRRRVLILAFTLLFFALVVSLVNECGYIGGMGSSERTCECLGTEVLQYDRTEADGPRRTICLGIVRSRDCFQYLDGPEVPCEVLDQR